MRPSQAKALTRPLLAMLVCCAFSFGAIVTSAFAVDYHSNCVGHGFVSGSSPTDGSFFSRVETGCGTATRYCVIYTSGVFEGQDTAYSGSSCNLWSNSIGTLSECHSTSHTEFDGVFADHTHTPNNYCG